MFFGTAQTGLLCLYGCGCWNGSNVDQVTEVPDARIPDLPVPKQPIIGEKPQTPGPGLQSRSGSLSSRRVEELSLTWVIPVPL